MASVTFLSPILGWVHDENQQLHVPFEYVPFWVDLKTLFSV